MYRNLSIALIVLGLVALRTVDCRAADKSASPARESHQRLSTGLGGHDSANKAASPARESHRADVVYVPTPHDVVLKMLSMAKVSKDDLLYDLGCGDGRIVVLAAKKYGCKAVGYDVDPQRIKECHENAKAKQVENLVQFKQENIFEQDLSPASVVTLYLLPSLNVKLIPQLEKLKAGSRIVSHDFDMQGVKPEKTVEFVSKEDNVPHTIYLWRTPLQKEKTGEGK